jgi:hypothetical protein
MTTSGCNSRNKAMLNSFKLALTLEECLLPRESVCKGPFRDREQPLDFLGQCRTEPFCRAVLQAPVQLATFTHYLPIALSAELFTAKFATPEPFFVFAWISINVRYHRFK